jgi:rare lipoprotein A (peptidoglycan hydrolase)
VKILRPSTLLAAGVVGLTGAGASVLPGRPGPMRVAEASAVAPARAAAVPAAIPDPVAPAAVEAARPALATATGEASYYARRFEGRTTASGVRFSNAGTPVSPPSVRGTS